MKSELYDSKANSEKERRANSESVCVSNGHCSRLKLGRWIHAYIDGFMLREVDSCLERALFTF
jgi:hypothetical protein